MKKKIAPLILTMLFVLVYLLAGIAGMKLVPSEYLNSASENLELLRDFTATLVIVTALFRICIDKLRGESLSSILTWFFVVACGVILIKESWIILGFMAVVLIVLLLITPADPNFKDPDRSVGANPDVNPPDANEASEV